MPAGGVAGVGAFSGPLQINIVGAGGVTAKLNFGDGIKEEDNEYNGGGVNAGGNYGARGNNNVHMEFSVANNQQLPRASERENGGAHPRIIDLTSDDEDEVQVINEPARTGLEALFRPRPRPPPGPPPRAITPLLEPKEEHDYLDLC